VTEDERVVGFGAEASDADTELEGAGREATEFRSIDRRESAAASRISFSFSASSALIKSAAVFRFRRGQT